MMRYAMGSVCVLAAAGLMFGCDVEEAAMDLAEQHMHGGAFEGIDELVAVAHPTAGNETRGVIRFEDLGDGQVRITAEIENLEPNQFHGFHIHEYGDCTADDATSAGGHYNPEDHPHGLPNNGERHAGDLGNLEADGDGAAEFELVVDNLTLAGEHNPIIGRSVIIHEGEDDGSQPLGDAGARIGCGVIGVANPQ